MYHFYVITNCFTYSFIQWAAYFYSQTLLIPYGGKYINIKRECTWYPWWVDHMLTITTKKRNRTICTCIPSLKLSGYPSRLLVQWPPVDKKQWRYTKGNDEEHSTQLCTNNTEAVRCRSERGTCGEISHLPIRSEQRRGQSFIIHSAGPLLFLCQNYSF